MYKDKGFLLTIFFIYFQGSGESEAQNIFPAAFSLMEHTPESPNLQDLRGPGAFTYYERGM